MNKMKIQIIGYSGSGKSTLAKKLASFYNIPYLHLDNVQYYGDFQIRDRQEQREIVEKYILKNDDWVIDGNYSDVAPSRFEISDITIYLNYNRFYCYKMARRRYKQNKGKIRDSFPCEERFDLSFQWWILFSSRIKKRRKKHLLNLNKTKGLKLMFKNKKQLDKWLLSIGIK